MGECPTQRRVAAGSRARTTTRSHIRTRELGASWSVFNLGGCPQPNWPPGASPRGAGGPQLAPAAASRVLTFAWARGMVDRATTTPGWERPVRSTMHAGTAAHWGGPRRPPWDSKDPPWVRQPGQRLLAVPAAAAGNGSAHGKAPDATYPNIYPTIRWGSYLFGPETRKHKT